jgi:hypothetical protein
LNIPTGFWLEEIMHECPICGQYCDCDGEDMDQEAPDDCTCEHEGSGLDELGNPIDDGYEEKDYE